MRRACLFLFVSASIILNVSFKSSGQSVVPGSDALLDKLRLNKGMGNSAVSYSSIEGNPFIFKDFEKAKLKLTSGETYDIKVRFDIYSNIMQVLNDGLIYAIGYPEKIQSVDLDKMTIVYSEYQKQGEGSYFILQADGKCKLLVKKNIRLQEAELPKPYQEGKPPKFIPKDDTYYLKIGNEIAILIRNKGDILSVLKDHKKEIEEYMTKNDTNVKKIEDLNNLIVYYNNL
jgi:predicted DNA-binding antitoxin AbrB/MazE fold protein